MKKIKGMSKAVRMKYLMYLFAVSLVAMLPIRLYQLLGLVELDTGFFSETNFTVVLVYVLALAVPLLFIVLSYISKEVPSPMLPVGKNYALGISSLVFSAALLYDAVINVFHIIPSTAGTIGIVLDVIKSNLSESGGMFLLARIVFAFLGCVWFLVFAVSHLGGNTAYKNYKLLALAPVCWAASRLVTYLTSPISFVNITELMFELYMLMFLMLFLITSARISTGVFSEDGMWGIYGFGLSAAFFGAVVTIPRAVVLIIGRENVQGYSFEPADLGALIFAVSYIFASFGIGFDGATQTRRLVSEVVLPEDGVVVKKSADREKAKSERAPASSEEETHGIFKVEDEIIENVPEKVTVQLEKENTPEPAFEESTKIAKKELFEAAEEISVIPEKSEEFSSDEETDYGELLKGFEDASNTPEKSSAVKKSGEPKEPVTVNSPEKAVKQKAPEKATADKMQDNAPDFSAEELFADSDEDEEAVATTNKKRGKASKLDKLRETAESADDENALKETKREGKAKSSFDKKAEKAKMKAQKEAAKKEKAEKATLEKAKKAELKETAKAQKKAQAEKAALEKAEKKANAEKAQKENRENAEARNKKSESEKKNIKNGEKTGEKAKDAAAKSSSAKEKALEKPEKKNKKEAQRNKVSTSEKKPEKKKEQKNGGFFGKKEKEPEEEIISTVSLKDMKNNRKN